MCSGAIINVFLTLIIFGSHLRAIYIGMFKHYVCKKYFNYEPQYNYQNNAR